MLKKILFAIATAISSYFCMSLGIMAPLAPFPLLVYFHTQNKYYNGLLVLLFAGLVMMNQELEAIFFLSGMFCLSVYLFFLTKRNSDVPKLVSQFTLVTGISILGIAAAYMLSHHLSINDLRLKLSQELVRATDLWIAKDPNHSSKFLFFKSNADLFAKNIVFMFPSYLIWGLGLTGWLNFVLLARHQVVQHLLAFPKNTEFTQFRAPFWLTPILIVLLGYFTFTYGQENNSIILVENLLRILCIPFFFQGLSVILYFLQKFKFGSASRSFIICLFFIPVLPMLTSIILGILDLFRDFRSTQGKGKIHASNT